MTKSAFLTGLSCPRKLNYLNNPKYLNTLDYDSSLRSLQEEGYIVGNLAKVYHPGGMDLSRILRTEVAVRKTKELLKTASVIGRNFYFKVLEEATQTIEEMDNKLEYLKDVQLINERKQKDEVEFLFKHALAQQSTYDSIVEKKFMESND